MKKRTWYPTKEAWARAQLERLEAAASTEVKWEGSNRAFARDHNVRRGTAAEADRMRRLVAKFARLGI